MLQGYYLRVEYLFSQKVNFLLGNITVPFCIKVSLFTLGIPYGIDCGFYIVLYIFSIKTSCLDIQ